MGNERLDNELEALAAAKTRSYITPKCAEVYERHRFGGRSGRYVNNRELTAVQNLLHPVEGKILDLACGTGRIAGWLKGLGKEVVGIDYSLTMLYYASAQIPGRLVCGDALALPFSDGTFEGVAIGRLFQHFADIVPFLIEIKRVLRPGGAVVFDTLRWSPRTLFFLLGVRTVHGVFAHSPAEVREAIRQAGLILEANEAMFLFAPGLYRYLPFGVVKLLDGVEKQLPTRWRVRTFWKAVKAGESGA